MTVEEYLAFERASDVRHEYYKGEIRAMAGGTKRHATITSNLTREVGNTLIDRPCSVMSSDMRTSTSPDGLYTYPDVVVECESGAAGNDLGDMLFTPTLIIEVLSRSTEARDRGFKFTQYRQIQSLREYALVAQDRPYVEVYRRQPGGQWLLSDFSGLDAVCVFESVDCRIPLARIYHRVTFDEGDVSPFGGTPDDQ